MRGTWYFIEACDVWMFRDGRPFSAGESHLIQSLFPPSALTMQGALRALVMHSDPSWMRRNNQSLHPNVGYGNNLGHFEMRGPYLAHWRRTDKGGQAAQPDKLVQVVPLPADLVYTKDKYFARPQLKASEGETNFPNPKLAVLESGEVIDDPPEQAWLEMDAFSTYLRGHTPQRGTGIAWSSEFFEEEPRFGIGLDQRTRRPVDRMLYRAAFKRPLQDTGLLVKVSDDVPLPQTPTVFRFGGEGRTARMTPVDAQQVISEDGLSSPSEPSQVKVVLLTPAYFTNGQQKRGFDTWQPSQGWATFFGEGRAILRAAALPKFQTLGGWDMEHRRSRPLVRLVPAGTVFYFDTDRLPDRDRPLTETPDGFPPFDKLGFGQYALGAW